MKSKNFTILRKFRIEFFHVLIAAYFFFCVYYAFERMLNMDSSLQLFQIINTKNFFFQENRLGMWLTQLPLLFSASIHVPIKFLVYIYSISFPFEYLLIIWINYRIFKSREAALATILSLIFGVAFTFYHSVSEIHQLLALSCLLFGLFQSKERLAKSCFYIILILLLFWCLFTHPNSVFTVFFVVGLAFLQKKINRFDIILSFSISVVYMIVKIFLTHKGSQDAGRYDLLLNFNETLPNFFSLYPFYFLYSKLFTTFFSCFCVIIIVWIKYKKVIELLFCTMCFLIFTVLSIMAFGNGDCDAVMEKAFMPGFFMFILIYSILFYQAKKRFIYHIIILLLCISSFGNIITASKPYTKRLNLLSEIMKNMDKHTPKIIISYSDFDETLRFNHWATSLDVLILSRCNSNTAKTIFYTDNKFIYAADTTNPNLFLYLPWDPYGIKKINDVYFNLPAIPYKLYKNTQEIYYEEKGIKNKILIHLLAVNNKYVCDDGNLNNLVVANRDSASEWETFLLILFEDNRCAIRSYDNHFLCAELGNKNEITATRDKLGAWETFTMIELENNFVAFKAANGKYLSVDEKTGQLFANADSIGEREKFEMIRK